MAAKSSRRLVIDASVARAAGGEDATFPKSKYCRDTLTIVLTVCHRMVMTPAIGAEWKKHRSNFARRWQVAMEARKKILHCGDSPFEKLREELTEQTKDEKQLNAIFKDLLLVEAALAADSVVLSLDDVVRELLRTAAASIGELRPIQWANPANEDEHAIVWLTRGARPEARRRLGLRNTNT